MSYEFYLNGILMPVTPGKLKLKIANNNKTVNLINEGDVNILKKAGLTEISFDLLLPNQEYPFANGSFMPAAAYLELFEELKVSREQACPRRRKAVWNIDAGINGNLRDYRRP